MSQLVPALPVILMESKNRALLKQQLPRKTITVHGTPRTCDVYARSPPGYCRAKSHLTTSTNIFNELQLLAGAPVYTKISLFPGRIVTRLSQANAMKHEPLPLFTVFRHLFRAQFMLKPIMIRRSRRNDSLVFRMQLFALRLRWYHLTEEP